MRCAAAAATAAAGPPRGGVPSKSGEPGALAAASRSCCARAAASFFSRSWSSYLLSRRGVGGREGTLLGCFVGDPSPSSPAAPCPPASSRCPAASVLPDGGAARASNRAPPGARWRGVEPGDLAPACRALCAAAFFARASASPLSLALRSARVSISSRDCCCSLFGEPTGERENSAGCSPRAAAAGLPRRRRASLAPYRGRGMPGGLPDRGPKQHRRCCGQRPAFRVRDSVSFWIY